MIFNLGIHEKLDLTNYEKTPCMLNIKMAERGFIIIIFNPKSLSTSQTPKPTIYKLKRIFRVTFYTKENNNDRIIVL